MTGDAGRVIRTPGWRQFGNVTGGEVAGYRLIEYRQTLIILTNDYSITSWCTYFGQVSDKTSRASVAIACYNIPTSSTVAQAPSSFKTPSIPHPSCPHPPGPPSLGHRCLVLSMRMENQPPSAGRSAVYHTHQTAHTCRRWTYGSQTPTSRRRVLLLRQPRIPRKQALGSCISTEVLGVIPS